MLGAMVLEGPSGACTDPERRGALPREHSQSQQGLRSWLLHAIGAGELEPAGKKLPRHWPRGSTASGTCLCSLRGPGTSSHPGMLPSTAGGGMRWLAAPLSQRTSSSQAWPGFGQPVRKGRRASCRHEPFPGSPRHSCPSRCIPRAGCDPGSRSDTFSKGKAQGSKGSSEHGGVGKKSELCSCQISSCFSGQMSMLPCRSGMGGGVDEAGGAAAVGSGGESIVGGRFSSWGPCTLVWVLGAAGQGQGG